MLEEPEDFRFVFLDEDRYQLTFDDDEAKGLVAIERGEIGPFLFIYPYPYPMIQIDLSVPSQPCILIHDPKDNSGNAAVLVTIADTGLSITNQNGDEFTLGRKNELRDTAQTKP